MSANGGGGGDDGSALVMRVAAIESEVRSVKATLDGLAKDTAELKGRAMAMPTTWQLITMVLAVIGVTIAVSAFTMNRIDRVEGKVDAILTRLVR